MPIEFHCEHCQKLLRTSEDKAGLSAQCPGCGAPITVPALEHSGAALESGTPGETPHRDSQSCPMCGTETRPGDSNCHSCGEPLEADWAGAQPGAKAPHRGVLLLTLSIVSWFLGCILFSIPIWIIAANDLKQMQLGLMDSEGEGLTRAARLISIVHVICFLAAFLFLCVLIPFLGALADPGL